MECCEIEIDTSLPGTRVVEALERLKTWRGVPEAIRSDNGPEFIGQALNEWCEENGVARGSGLVFAVMECILSGLLEIQSETLGFPVRDPDNH